MPAGETSRWPPKTNGMPDLSALNGKLVLNLAFSAMFRGTGPVDPNARLLCTNYVRLVDQLVWEYNASRAALQEHIDTPNVKMSHLLRATAHMETHINTMRRAILFARRMRGHKDSPHIERHTVLSGNAGDRLVRLRNAIEHSEDCILRGEVDEGDPATLLVQCDRVELLGIEISYAELADWTRQLHSLAGQLVHYQDPARATQQ